MGSSADIIVVGCGVAGATAAQIAASLGSKVLVLEEHDSVGIPSHCSGHVSIHGIKRLGISLPNNIIKNEIRGVIFHSPGGKVLRLEYDAPITWVLDRRALDQHLAERAEKSGAQILLNSRAVSMQTCEAGRVRIGVSTKGEVRTLDCKLVIDCEGSASTLKPPRPHPANREPMWVNSIQAHVEDVRGLSSDMVEVFLGSAYAPGFFAWIVPWRDGSAKVGLAAREGNPRILFERFIARHPKASRELNGASIRKVLFHPVPLAGPIHKTFYPGMLIAGDSAHQVKPTTGGGVVFSLMCGKRAGRVAHEASTLEDTSEAFLSRYERGWKSEIGRDLDAMRYVRRMLFRLPDRRLDSIFSIARTFGATAALRRTEEVDMQGKATVRLGLDPRYTATLLFSAILSLPFVARSAPIRRQQQIEQADAFETS